MVEFRNRLKELRARDGLNQTELAKKLGRRGKRLALWSEEIMLLPWCWPLRLPEFFMKK